MITINNDLINETPASLLYKDNTIVGIIKNVLAFNDVRIQIAKEKSRDYSISFNGVKYPIDQRGTLSSWPKGLFDLLDDQLDEMIVVTSER